MTQRQKRRRQNSKFVLAEVSFSTHWHGQVWSDPSPPCHPSVCGLSEPPPPRGTRVRTCLSSTFLRSVRVPHHLSPPLLRLQLIESAWSWRVRAYRCQPGRYTLYMSCGPEPSIIAVGLADHLYKWDGGENTGGGGGSFLCILFLILISMDILVADKIRDSGVKWVILKSCRCTIYCSTSHRREK